MIKRFAQIMFFVFALVLVYTVYKNKEDENIKNASWHGLKKLSKEKIIDTPVPSRISKLPTPAKERAPASVPSSPSLAPHSPFISEAPEWKRALGEELLSIEEADSEIFIKEEKRISKIENNKMINYKHVIIQVIRKSSPSSSYEALIDNKGKIQKTWARTKFEPVGDKRENFIEL